MKICYEFTMPGKKAKSFFDSLHTNWKKISKSDTELVIKHPKIGTDEFRFSIDGHVYADMLRTTEMVEGIVQAQREGFDGAAIGCFGDPGLDVLKSVVSIPVTGPAKSALILGQAVGNKMAFISLPHWEKKLEKLIMGYGARDFFISRRPCRSLTISTDDFSEEKLIIENFLELAKSAIDDGADVVTLGCTKCSTLLTSKDISHVDGVPVIDGALAALKLVEMMVDFRKSAARSTHQSIETEVMEGLREFYYHGSESMGYR